MSQVLYRKYRPTRLQDVVGQEHITKVLDNTIKQNKIGHAYLFIGPRGTGKTSVARIFAHAVNAITRNGLLCGVNICDNISANRKSMWVSR